MPDFEPVRWGICATGKIAHKFAEDLAVLNGAVVAAVGSRTVEGARTFAERHGGTPYGSYEELFADPDVEVVYLASPHGLHPEHVRMALEAGKPVLCEKPLAVNAALAEEMFALAAERGLFLMEAMWTACHPLVVHLRERMRAGDFGRPRQLVADLGFVVTDPPESRMFDPALGAGTLLDMGIYPLTLAQLFLGDPVEVAPVAHLSDDPRGAIDLNLAIAQRYESGAVAALTASMTAQSPRTASIATDTGRLDFPAGFHHPSYVTWTPYDDQGRPREPQRIDPPSPVIGAGYGNEAQEVARCLRAGELQSPLVPHAQTLALLQQTDAIRAQLGVRYPEEH